MGFRNTTVEFVNFFVEIAVSGIYLFLDDGRSSAVSNAYRHHGIEIPICR